MRYNIIAIPSFKKKVKILAKKYPSFKKDFSNLIDELEITPTKGISLGNNCYKIRLAISSKKKGKSGGARIITTFVITEKTLYFLTIYDKSQKENITNKELKDLLKDIEE